MPVATETVSVKTSILDLDADCLIPICKKLDQWDLYALREVSHHFGDATNYCFRKTEMFQYGKWMLKKIGRRTGIDLVKVLEYFGERMEHVCIDAPFTTFTRKHSVQQSFLSKRLQNVRHLKLSNVDHAEVKFVSTLPDITELEVSGVDWMPFEARWPHLKRLTVHTTACFLTDYDSAFIAKLTDFLLAHKSVQKLIVRIPFRSGVYKLEDQEKIFDVIATNLHELTEVDLLSFPACHSSEKLFSLKRLEVFKIPDLVHVDLLKSLNNLKVLHVENYLSLNNLYDIVEFAPTLEELTLYLHVSDFDKDALNILIRRRKLSPHCEDRLLHFNNLDLKRIVKLPSDLKRNEKYVSCVYCYRQWLHGHEY